MTAVAEPIYVPNVPPPQRHPLIFSTFDALAPEAAFELVNDHDPLPLRMQFDRLRTGQFEWAYLQSGPTRWHVRITRLRAGSATGTPGGCGGERGGCGCSGG